MTLPIDLSSIGFLCQQLQLPIARIRAAADRLAIEESRLNGVTHYSAADVERIREAILAEMRSRESHVLDQRSNVS